jgi:hypothetical protein
MGNKNSGKPLLSEVSEGSSQQSENADRQDLLDRIFFLYQSLKQNKALDFLKEDELESSQAEK